MVFSLNGLDVAPDAPQGFTHVTMTAEEYKTLSGRVAALEDEKRAILNVAKERGNKERDLRPRKDHPGLLLTGCREVTFAADLKGQTKKRSKAVEYSFQTSYKVAEYTPGAIRGKAVEDVRKLLDFAHVDDAQGQPMHFDDWCRSVSKAEAERSWRDVFMPGAAPTLLAWRMVAPRFAEWWEITTVLSAAVTLPPTVIPPTK